MWYYWEKKLETAKQTSSIMTTSKLQYRDTVHQNYSNSKIAFKGSQ